MSWWDDFVKGADDAPTIEEQNRQQAMADALDRNGPGGGYNPLTDYKPTDDPSAVGRGTYVDDQGQWGYSNADEWMKNMGSGPGGMAHEVAPYLGALGGAAAGLPMTMMASGLNASGIDVDPLSQLTKFAGRGAKDGASSGSGSGSSAGQGSMPPVGGAGPSGYMSGEIGLPTISGFNEGYNPGDIQQQPMPTGDFGPQGNMAQGNPMQMAAALEMGGAARRMKTPDYTGGHLQFGF